MIEVASVKRNANDSRQHKAREPAASGLPVSEFAGAPFDFVIYRKASCACGGGCPSCQTKNAGLKVSHPDDTAEIEADRIADKVMRMAIPSAPQPVPSLNANSRRNAGHGSSSLAKTPNGGTTGSGPEEQEKMSEEMEVRRFAAGAADDGVRGGFPDLGAGRPLDRETREFFEPRFGADFGSVRIHTGPGAENSARSVDALAFTFGKNVVFGEGQYQPGTAGGRGLIAHELAHVVQQRGAPKSVQRRVAASSRCTPSVHSAPADPLAELARLEGVARNRALGARNALDLEAITLDDPVFGRSDIFTAYRHWFGAPQSTAAGTFRSRFRTAPFPTEREAIAHEMRTLAHRFEVIADWLGTSIRYHCPGTAAFTIPGCRAGRCGVSAAVTCGSSGSHTIEICPNFWSTNTDDGRSGYLIHEATHPAFHFLQHQTTPGGRPRNPGCFEGFIYEIFGDGVTPADCTALP